MVIAIGCDMVDHTLTTKLRWDSNLELQRRFFSQDEIDIFNISNNINFLAGRFAVKEAVLKCLGTGMEDGLLLTDIRTLRCENGRPRLELFGETKILSDKLGINYWHVSITHSENCSTAYVIAEKKSKKNINTL